MSGLPSIATNISVGASDERGTTFCASEGYIAAGAPPVGMRQGQLTPEGGDLCRTRRRSVARPLAARAQQAGRIAIIGFLGADASAFSPWTDAFVARLRELGWIEGSTIAIEIGGRKAGLSVTPRSQPSLSAQG